MQHILPVKSYPPEICGSGRVCHGNKALMELSILSLLSLVIRGLDTQVLD